MNKLLTSCAISALLLTIGSSVSAQEISREGSLFGRLGAVGIFPTAHSKYTVAGYPVFKTKYKNSAGVELGAGYFFTDNFAADLSVGYTEYKLKNNGYRDALLTQTFGQLPDGVKNTIKTKSFPATLMLQFHTSAYGVASPYVGAGYSYNFTKKKHSHTYNINGVEATYRMKPKNVGTPVVQLGSNFDLGQNLGLNVDVKYSWLKPKYKVYSEITPLLGTKRIDQRTYKVKTNPVVVTVGLTYKF